MANITQIQILIVEDHPLVAMEMEDMLVTAGYKVAGTLSYGEDVDRWLEENECDLVLIDIKLAGKLSGLEVIKQCIQPKNLAFIIISAQQDRKTIKEMVSLVPHAFLSKPYKELDLIAAVEIAVQKGLYPQDKEEKSNYIYLKTGKYYEKIIIDNILWLEANGNYTTVYETDKKIMLSTQLGKLLERLPETKFVRIHRSYAINLLHLKVFKENSVWIKDIEIPLSSSYREHLLKKIELL